MNLSRSLKTVLLAAVMLPVTVAAVVVLFPPAAFVAMTGRVVSVRPGLYGVELVKGRPGRGRTIYGIGQERRGRSFVRTRPLRHETLALSPEWRSTVAMDYPLLPVRVEVYRRGQRWGVDLPPEAQTVRSELMRHSALDPSSINVPQLSQATREAIAQARREAASLGHNYAGTEHLLMALLRQAHGVAAEALAAFGITADGVMDAVVSKLGQHKRGRSAEPVRMAERTLRAIDRALLEARNRNQESVAPEHLLLALILDEDSLAVGLLQGLDVSMGNLRAEVLRVLGESA